MKRNLYIKIKHIWVAILSLCLIMLSACNLAMPFNEVSSGSYFPDFSDVISKVMPSVVAISTESVTYDNFNHPQTSASSGSGWVIDRFGNIVTNNHVIEGATSIIVELYNHQAYSASIVSTDPISDIAVIRINTGWLLQPLAMASTLDLKVGDWVIVIGNPLGLGISAKQGIISRLGVNMSSSPEQMYYNMIETSAAINPGNSGGPMVNINGEVIGITSLKINSAGIEGMGYAIAMNDAMPIINVLLRGERVIRAWMGISVIGVDSGLASVFNLNIRSGALITGVCEGSPAEKAGLKIGDVIVNFNNLTVNSDDDMVQYINQSKVGQGVKITYWRDQTRKTVELTLVENPPCSPTSVVNPVSFLN